MPILNQNVASTFEELADFLEIDGNPAGPAREVCILVLAADLESMYFT